ncbi:MAG TPA: ABC transporter permease [Gemmatimonadaceae bacterium]|nr:ABC transporter permease [Gemmatimonadaceae bacterium]
MSVAPFLTRALALLEGVGIAFDSIRSNKARAALTIAGVAVGVFVVVAISAAIYGINRSVAADFEAAGPTSFFIYKYPIEFNTCDGTDETCPWIHYPPLTVEETRAIEQLPSIRGATIHIGSSAAFRYKDRRLASGLIDLYTPSWTDVDGGDISPGRSFTYAENETAARLVLINDKMAEVLFGDAEPLDKSIYINGVPFRIIGLYHYKASFLGTPGREGGDRPRAVVPFETGRRHLGVRVEWADLTIKPHDGVPRDQAMDEVTALLRGVRGLKPGQTNNFFVTPQEKLFEFWNRLTRIFFFVMLVLSGIGLMVGGVGVIAIMMISVTERTREIGVRKALGATKGTILWQFLVEAATLTGVGAILGLLIGVGLTALVRTATPIPASIPGYAIFMALAASAFTGILFGLLPAIRAAKLDPVDALRYE